MEAKKVLYIATDGGSVANGTASCVASWGYYGIDENNIPGIIESYNKPKIKSNVEGASETTTFFAKSGIIFAEVLKQTLGEFAVNTNCTVLAAPEKATNNIGELTAIYHALLDPRVETADKIIIIGDSEYSLKSVDIYSRNWVKDPQRHKINEKKNLNLILNIKNRIDELRKTKQVILKHIHSHLKQPKLEVLSGESNTEWIYWMLNNQADLLCNLELEKIRPVILGLNVKETKKPRVKKPQKNDKNDKNVKVENSKIEISDL